MLVDSKQVFLNQISETKESGLYKNERIIRSMQRSSIEVNGNKVIICVLITIWGCLHTPILLKQQNRP